METVRRAVIDVGTNSVKLLVADVTGHEVRPVWEGGQQTRLGRGFYEARRLQPGPIADTARAAAEFVARARELRAASVRVIATSATREAVNAGELTAAIEEATGLKVEIISGQKEADWAFLGVTTDPRLDGQPFWLFDVGGGSTEVIIGEGVRKIYSRSFPLGTVRLMETVPHSEPPRAGELGECRRWLREFLRREVRPGVCGNPKSEARSPKEIRSPKSETEQAEGGRQKEEGRNQKSEVRGQMSVVRCQKPEVRSQGSEGGGLGPRPSTLGPQLSSPVTLHPSPQLVGAGGTATVLGCMEARLETFDRKKIEATRMSRERVRWHVERLWGMPIEERKQIVGLPKNRADVILTGVAIYEAVMEEFGFEELRATTRGLRFAAVMEPGFNSCG